jgi:hypothetical protein
MTGQGLPLQGQKSWRAATHLRHGALALALGGAARHVAASRLVVALADHDDDVQRPVELPVTATAQPGQITRPGAGLDWGGCSQRGCPDATS